MRTLLVTALALGALGWTILGGAPAAAQPAVDAGPAPMSGCGFEGEVAVAPGVLVYDRAKGGEAIAKFTGVRIPLVVQDVPIDVAGTRAPVLTGSGKGNFRIDGYVLASELPFQNTREVAVIGTQVWLSSYRPVKVTEAKRRKFLLSRDVQKPIRRKVEAWVSCDLVELGDKLPAETELPEKVKGFVGAKDTIKLYDDYRWDKKVVLELDAAMGAVFWSEERQGSLVNIVFEGDVVLSAWANASDLKSIPTGELVDQLRPVRTVYAAPKLAATATVREHRVTRDVPIRLEARAGAPAVGVIEPETDVLVLETTAGWSSVIPKSLAVAPADGKQFWVPAASVGSP